MAYLPNIMIFMGCTTLLMLTGCEKQPPSERPPVTAAAFMQGDATIGQQQYDKACGNCHKLQPGNNQKAPQLLRIYGSKSALLTDYSYSEALKNANLTWTSDNLNNYIANPKQMIAGTKMKSDPVTDPVERQNIIAYLATLR